MHLDNFREKDRALQVHVSTNLQYFRNSCIININLEVKA
jgi:hypothetical protein